MRKELALNLVETLRQQLPNADISVRGSVSNGTDDQYSDIDILVDDPSQSNSIVLKSVIFQIENNFSVEFHDTAKGFLPKECVVGFIMKDLPLHCCVEVAITTQDKHQDLTKEDIINKEPERFIKLWIIAARKLARTPDQIPMDLKFLTSMLNVSIENADSPEVLLSKTVKKMGSSVRNKYPNLYEKCENEINRISEVTVS